MGGSLVFRSADFAGPHGAINKTMKHASAIALAMVRLTGMAQKRPFVGCLSDIARLRFRTLRADR